MPGTSDPGVASVRGCSFAGDIGLGCKTAGDVGLGCKTAGDIGLAAGRCQE